jgi:hypothetical protein
MRLFCRIDRDKDTHTPFQVQGWKRIHHLFLTVFFLKLVHLTVNPDLIQFPLKNHWSWWSEHTVPYVEALALLFGIVGPPFIP